MNLISPSRHAGLLAKALVPAAAFAVVITLMPSAPSATTVSPKVRPAASGTTSLRFASFNVQSVGLDKTKGNQRPWKTRRGTVIRQILGESTDVIGVQEVNPSSSFARRLVDGKNQFLDLRNGLNKAGGHYQLANANAYNCRRASTSYKCQHKYRGASQSERILYDTRVVTNLYAGSMHYKRQGAGHTGLYLAWAWMRAKANGHKFLFTTTHLDPAHRSIRKAQWWQMINKIKKIRRGFPVVSVGDFNTQKFDTMTKAMLPAMRKAGFGDVLNQQYHTNPAHGVRAQHRINAWINSNNHLRRNMRSWSYENRHDKIGNNIDYIFASNSLKVPEFKLVVNRSGLNVRGVFPSDHCMIRSTINI